MKIKNALIYIIIIALVVIDQFIKYIICKELNLFESIQVIKNFLYITYVENNGAAWSLLSGNQVFLIIISLVIIILFYIYFIRNKKIDFKNSIIYGILYGGIVGNLIDRIIRGNVIDYIDVKIFNYDFPVFNLADICIVLSVIMLGILILRGDKDENNS